ncbi:MAG: aldo/keto reductase [Candidatus Heimdallarchaeota archaeon]|nr:MAG: aldo/keto reductase [Candidatus Heimdallarchaeota archaeon]
MYTRRLGKSNIKVSALGMGCFAIGGPFQGKNGNFLAYGYVNDDESKKTIHKAIDLGVNFFDTADVYGCGHSERILGSVLSDYDRNDLVIATKFANEFNEVTKTVIGKNVDPNYIRNALDASCKRLKTDFIDLYQLHDGNHDIESAKNVMNILEDLVEEGQIRGYGWSTDDIMRAKIFAEGENCTAIQYAIHITRSNPKMIELCKQHDLAGVIRSPLGSGTLTGKYSEEYMKNLTENHMWYKRDFISEEWFIKRQKKLEKLKELLIGEDLTIVQALLSYLWSTSDKTIPIPGAKTVMQIEENAAILEYGPLKPDLLRAINEIFEEIRISV